MPHKTPEARRAYYLAHKTREAAYARAYRAVHKDSMNAKKRAWYVANKAEALAYAHTYYDAHQQERAAYNRTYSASHRAALTAKTRARRRANPALVSANNRRYIARKKGATINDLTHAQWLEIQAAQDYHCYYCGKRCKGRLTQDHILPLSQGGSHTLHNIIGACKSCNSKKHTNTPPIPVQPLLLTIAPAVKKRRRT